MNLSPHRRSSALTRKSSLTKPFSRVAWLLLTACYMMAVSANQENRMIEENELYRDIFQEDKSYLFYSLKISDRHFTGEQYLAFKVVADSFDSDPDIFISRENTQPKNSNESSWFCAKDGSDTCFIENSEIEIWQTYHIGVRCINQCRYHLRAYYTPIRVLPEDERTQFRLEAVSTNIFQYYIPQETQQGTIRGATIKAESVTNYRQLDMFLSSDKDFYEIEERQNAQIILNGKGFRLTDKNQNWCTRCFVYIVLDVMEEGRYYLTGQATARSIDLRNEVASQEIANAGQQQCFRYFVNSQTRDLIYEMKIYQGDGETYLTKQNQPSDVQDSSILLFAEKSSARGIIVTSQERLRFGQDKGTYFICVYAYSQMSFQLTVSEKTQSKLYDAVDDMMYSFSLSNNDYIQFRYTGSDLQRKTTIHLELKSQNVQQGQLPPLIFYKICDSPVLNDCVLDEDRARGRNSDMIQVGTLSKSSASIRISDIHHDPSRCPNPSSCYYLISVYYQYEQGPTQASFKISNSNQSPATVNVDGRYRNIKKKGTYEYYGLMRGTSSGRGFLDAVIVTLKTFVGDADLVASTSESLPTLANARYKSQKMDEFDQIVINRTINYSLDVPIYVGVYTWKESQYELQFTPVYSTQYNERLTQAQPLTQGVPVYNYMTNEYDESFYSFYPWWSGGENRTIVFFAEMIFNKIFFQVSANRYPSSTNSQWADYKDMIVIPPTDPQYTISSSYFIRIRPDFSLYDLISKKQYIFNFYAISQPQSDTFQDMQGDDSVVGYANESTTFYRHYSLKRNETYVFTIASLMGKPQMLIASSDQEMFPNNEDRSTYDYQTSLEEKESKQITLTYEMRKDNGAACNQAGYPLDGGNKKCTTYVGVYCESQCAYNLTLTIVGKDDARRYPKYIAEDVYHDDSVTKDQIQYYYYPVSKETGDVTFLLNKTSNIGQNGDSLIMANIQDNSEVGFENWVYPVPLKFMTSSFTRQVQQPEMIELCGDAIRQKCKSNSCVVILGVIGLTSNMKSQFRLRVYTAKNKLVERNPISSVIPKAGQYQYYWFTNNATVNDSRAYWEYSIALSAALSGQDVDLYVSLVDGRMPVSRDFDLYQNNLGPDDVVISANDTFFRDRNYNTSYGIMVVVGVKALTDNANYSLMIVGPNHYRLNLYYLYKDEAQQNSFPALENRERNASHFYKFFNWGHQDFRLTLQSTDGEAQIYLNYLTEEAFTDNAYLATPYSQANSRWTATADSSQAATLRVFKEDQDNGNFCYYCLYYVRVVPKSSSKVSYSLSYTSIDDGGDNIEQIKVNQPTSLTLPSTGSVTQRKFLLESMDHFVISFTVATGKVIVYAGLYPEQPLTKYAWRAEGEIGTTSMKVRQIDQNFHLATFYYVTVQATDGRASLQLTVKQDRSVSSLGSGIVIKDEYYTMEERVKFYYFRAPKGSFKATLDVNGLTEDFYPTIVVSQDNRTSRPSDFRTLKYPTLESKKYIFGDNYSYLAYRSDASYSFTDNAETDFTYFTIGLYSFSYGMTDRRKAEFQLTLTIESTLQKQDTQLVNREESVTRKSLWTVIHEKIKSAYDSYLSDTWGIANKWFLQ